MHQRAKSDALKRSIAIVLLALCVSGVLMTARVYASGDGDGGDGASSGGADANANAQNDTFGGGEVGGPYTAEPVVENCETGYEWKPTTVFTGICYESGCYTETKYSCEYVGCPEGTTLIGTRCVAADLTAGAVRVSSGEATSGSDVRFTGPVTNGGEKPIPETFNNSFQIDIGGDGTWDQWLDDASSMAGLAAGASASVVSQTWIDIPEGTHFVRLCADLPPFWNGSIVEVNENNNCGPHFVFVVTPPCVDTSTTSCGVTTTTNSCTGTSTMSGTFDSSLPGCQAGCIPTTSACGVQHYSNCPDTGTFDSSLPGCGCTPTTFQCGIQHYSNCPDTGTYDSSLPGCDPCPSNKKYDPITGTCIDIPKCTPSNFCSGRNLYHTNAKCQESLVRECAYQCSVGGCIDTPDPDGEFRASPSLVRSGESTRLYWSVDNVESCVVTGSNGDRWTTRSSGAAGIASSPLVTRTTFSITCEPLEGSDASDFTGSAIVNVVPTFNEI